MNGKQGDLEARIVAIEYALQVLIDCLGDRNAVDPAKIARLLTTAAGDPQAASSNIAVPRALNALAERI
ncbi:hypothetical protein [Methylobacterium organophilum]|uniref:Uncharacterized protein n=1 Tax=Methylobacterium organophilum TaxID=410 RepID=A0ABQ4TBV1_METOR|nr:hypothetical protein [Methylobacterium organophilum]UMY17445.1 hypothetical protein MMB17_22965 [Methylobacterium organophilum]GJE29160.1 hypothetical protein LKMONMHP_4039 [Methylobacterium organophilum]